MDWMTDELMVTRPVERHSSDGTRGRNVSCSKSGRHDARVVAFGVVVVVR